MSGVFSMEKIYAARACPAKVFVPKPQGQLNTWQLVKEFMYGGNATFTIKNTATNTRYTFRVKRVKYKDHETQKLAPYFVFLLMGKDNINDYKYMASLFMAHPYFLASTYKSRLKPDSPPWIALQWVLRQLEKSSKGEAVTWPAGFQFWHEGKCGRCGRPLTDPESIARGYGPYCATVDNVGG